MSDGIVDGIAQKVDKDRQWLVWTEVDKRPKIRTGNSSRIPKDAAGCKVELVNLTVPEMDAIEGAVNGSSYVIVKDGRLHAYSAFRPLPAAVDDPIISPYWRLGPEETPKVNGDNCKTYSGKVIIHHILENYEKWAAKLEEWGFVCLRSKRGDCGRYWEHWLLHAWDAKGDLKKAIDEREDKSMGSDVNAVCDFIVRRRVPFGSMDVMVQRWAYCVE